MMSDKSENRPHEPDLPSERNPKAITRRGFVGTVAAAGAAALTGALSTGCKKEEQKPEPPRADTVAPKTKPAAAAARRAKTEVPNIIILIADTFRTDHLGCYGPTRVKTPNLDRLARDGVVFTNVTTEGLPTIPCRRVYHTGKSVLPGARWEPLGAGDTTFAQIAGKKGFTTGFIADTYHYFAPGYNFHRGFSSWEWVRGQESDKWRSGPKEAFEPRKHMPDHLWNETYDKTLRQYMMNTQGRRGPEDYFCARSCEAAAAWLERNAGNVPFMLWVDMFDPHEPWDAPPEFQKMYREEYPFDRYLFGYGVRHQDIRPDDLPVIRDLYAAEVTFSDYCIGRFLDRVEQMGLLEDTVVVFSTDHGTHLGEEGCVQKTAGLLNRCVTHIPLIVRHPDRRFAGQRVDGLVSAVDYLATFLSLAGIRDYENLDGRDAWKLVTGEAESIHDEVYSVFLTFGAVHTLDWHYFQNVYGKDPGKGPALYDLKSDPLQTKNVLRDFPDQAGHLRGKLRNHLGIEIPPLRI
jgi:arylsulfatase A-like enzyme